MGHGLHDCKESTQKVKEMMKDSLPFLIALRVESNVFGNESLQLRSHAKKSMIQSSYVGDDDGSG